ncbi:hypothetical protein EDC04DRAFT_2576509, partial [Pisolithus marmoratus]
ARRAVRTNNFTQQTNVVDADKHKMAYIEENLRIHSGPPDPLESKSRDTSAQAEFTLSERAVNEESVIASVPILTTIPEADLGMECALSPLESIEEMEKAKRQVCKLRQLSSSTFLPSEHRGSLPVYRPHINHKSDVEIM